LRLAGAAGVIAVAPGLALAACSGPAPAASAPSAAATRVTQAPVASAPATPAVQYSGGLGFGAACAGHGSPKAAPYRGAGPHSVDFEGDPSVATGSGNTDTGVADGVLVSGQGNAEDPDDWRTTDPGQVQLVACVSFEPTSKSVGSCAFDIGGGAELDEADFSITLYVARTGQRLAGPVMLAGTDHTCPSSAFVDGMNPVVYTALSVPEVVRQFGKYVTATVA
jgi:hypothetical protein